MASDPVRSAPGDSRTLLATAPPPFLCDSLTVVLIRPTRYDDDGYVVRHWRGTLPSNTLSCLNGLTHEAVASGALGAVAVRVHTFDESVDRIDPRLARTFRRPGTRVLVALVGVQTNQFPRAQDLARQFKAEGFDVMIGGFHVSGSVAMAHAIPPECQAMIDEGITLVLGEVEDRWAALLQDAAAGRLLPLYDFLKDLPDLRTKPLPKVLGASAAEVRGARLRHDRCGPRLPVQLFLLHHHQRAGPRDAQPRRGAHHRTTSGLTTVPGGRRASGTTSSPTTTSPATRSGKRSSTDSSPCARTRASPSTS